MSIPQTIRINLKIKPSILKFIAQFIIFISIFYFLSIQFESVIPMFNMRATSRVLWVILDRIGVDAALKGNILTFDKFSIQIVRQCTGIFEAIALSAVMLAYPTSKENKLAGIVFAVPVIYLINMMRLVFLSLLGVRSQFLFEAVHEYFFQITFVFLVIFFWLLWLNKVVKDDKDKK